MWKRYKKSSLFAMFCGAVTSVIGVSCLFFAEREAVLAGLVTAAVFVNMALHFESFFNSLREGKRREGVCSIALAELFFVCFGLHTLSVRGIWYGFLFVFAFYLVVNGASLAAMPIRLARACGVFAVVSGVVLYACAQAMPEKRSACAAAICAALVINGVERILMSIAGGRRKVER